MGTLKSKNATYENARIKMRHQKGKVEKVRLEIAALKAAVKFETGTSFGCQYRLFACFELCSVILLFLSLAFSNLRF